MLSFYTRRGIEMDPWLFPVTIRLSLLKCHLVALHDHDDENEILTYRHKYATVSRNYFGELYTCAQTDYTTQRICPHSRRRRTLLVRNKQRDFIGHPGGILDSYWSILTSIQQRPWLMWVLPRWKQGWNGRASATSWKVSFIIVFTLLLTNSCYLIFLRGNIALLI